MGDEVASFFKDLSYVGLGTIIGAIFLFTFNVLVGRLLGPLEYGKFSLVQTISMFLYIPMLMGYNNAMVKYNSEKENFERQRTIISTTFILVLIFTTLSVLVYLIIPQEILKYFSISSEIFHLSIICAVLFVIYTLLTNTLNGLHEMKKFAMITPIQGFTLLFSFLFIASAKMISYKSAIVTMLLAYIVTSGFILFFIRKYFIYKFDKFWAYALTNYGINTIVGSITFMLYSNVNQILINIFMGTENLGIYNAYYFASISIAILLFNTFIGVFFPAASKYRDKTIILKKVNQMMPYLIIFGVPSIIFVEFLVLNLYGRAYNINFPLMTLFSIVSVLFVYYGVYNWTFYSGGIKDVKLVNKSTILIVIIDITLAICFIPRLGLIGALISNAIAFIGGICFLSKKELYPNYNDIGLQS